MRRSIALRGRAAAALSVFALAASLCAPALAKGPASVAWKRINTDAAPAPRAAQAMAYDPVSGKVVLFGGFGTFRYFGDTWTFDGTTWTQVATPVAPSARAAAAMAYDEVTHQLVLYGGYDGRSYLGDTWLWDGATSTWTQATPASAPSAASGPMMFSDPLNGHATMFGGYNGMYYLGSTLQWDGSDWVDLQPAFPPPGRGAGIAVLDASDHRVVMYGGIASINPFGTWLWDGTNWSRGFTSTQPPLTYYSCAAYDPNIDEVVMFGGAAGGPDLNDTWGWDGTDWNYLTTGRTPAGRESASMAYDAALGATVMFGGFDIQAGKLYDDTWVLSPK